MEADDEYGVSSEDELVRFPYIFPFSVVLQCDCLNEFHLFDTRHRIRDVVKFFWFQKVEFYSSSWPFHISILLPSFKRCMGGNSVL